MTRNILIIAAHPDDEVLGCGGAIAKFAEEGATINAAFLADGIRSRSDEVGDPKIALNARRNAAEAAGKILGIKSVNFENYPDNQMDTVGLLNIVKSVEALISKFNPDTVLTHHSGDLNIDHRITCEAVVTACRPQKGNTVKQLLCFEVPSSTEWQLADNVPAFLPNWFVDISSTLDRKLTALDAYATELRDWPHPRSREGVGYLARWRGAMVGCDAAEAFVLGRLLS